MIVLAAALAMHAAAAPPDFRRAWTCGSSYDFDDITTSVIRTLDEQGKQLDVDVQWSVGTPRPFTASVFAMAHRKGAGDPPLRDGLVLLSWNGRMIDGVDTSKPVAVLHAEGAVPRRSDGRPRVEHSETSFTVDVPRERVAMLSRGADRAELSVLNASNVVIHSAGVEVRRVGRAMRAVEESIEETRWQMRDHEKRCEPVTEWLTF